jgi:hypothetical membrane protein
MARRVSAGLHAGWLAGLVFALALAWAGSGVDGYEHARNSVGMLGSRGVPVAAVFNGAGFVLPGLLLLAFALAIGARLREGGSTLAARLGVHLALISAIAFAAQGVLPLDPAGASDGVAAQRHVFALTIALLAAVPSMALLAAGLHGQPAWRPLPWLGATFAALLLAAIVFPVHEWWPGAAGRSGLSQRVAFLAYFAWPAAMSAVALRRQSFL